jgi:hypothetical protein
MLLHYKFLNFEQTLKHHHAQRRGLGQADLAHGWGQHYQWSAEMLRKEWTRIQANRVDTGAPDFRPWRSYQPPRWWRSPIGVRWAGLYLRIQGFKTLLSRELGLYG